MPPHWMPFVDWWNDPVLRDRSDRKFSRMELVRNVADTDGGAHADADLEESYDELSRRNSLGWNFHARGTELPLPGTELACIRQFAHELLLTLDERMPR